MNEGNAIMELARQANLPSCHLTHPKALARFAALVRAAALAEAAEVCKSQDMESFGVLPIRAVMITNACAAAIQQLMSVPDGKETK